MDIVDKVSDALWLSPATHDVNPVNLDPHWARVCAGVHRLNHGLMVVLDVDKVLDLARFGAAA
jgi:purine-binding chemotaxis protein CheW